jgi:SAM-dependent methyltransferase
MLLSELVDYRNRLDQLTVSKAVYDAKSTIDQIIYTVEKSEDLSLPNLITANNLHKLESIIQEGFANFDQEFQLIKSRVQTEIELKEKQYFVDSYKLFDEAVRSEESNQVLYDRKKFSDQPSQESIDMLMGRLSAYNNWKYPGLIIRPGLEDFIDSMVGLDPLYLVDQNYDHLKPCLERFPVIYQNRLRTYVANDWTPGPKLDKIPNGQFGLCVAYRYFNYRPFEIIKQYLEEIYTKLRPGGVLLMTFNDCDTAYGVRLVEKYFCSYTPGSLVKQLASTIGYEITNSWNEDGASVWLELSKRGELTGLRGGQTIATVQHKELLYGDQDYQAHRSLSDDEKDELRRKIKQYGHDWEDYKNIKGTQLISVVESLGIEYEKRQQEKFAKRAAKEHAARLEEIAWHEAEQRRILSELADQNAERVVAEKKKLEEFQAWAKGFEIDPAGKTEEEVKRLIAEKVDTTRLLELKLLREKALRLGIGNPNLVKYGYSAEKLKQLIKEKENK